MEIGNQEEDLANSWEKQYGNNKLDFLRDLNELAHYSVIIGYLRYFSHGGAFFDVGCGEGVLLEQLPSDSFSRYVGIDISKTAIERAKAKARENSTFVVSSIESYTPVERYDVFILNEVLYYLNAPLQLLDHYRLFLNENGIFIVSMFCDERNNRLWEILDSTFSILDETRITNAYNTSWICKVYQPHKPA